MYPKKGFARLPVLIAIVLGLIIVGYGAYVVMHKNNITLGQGVVQVDGSYQFPLSNINSNNFVVNWGDGQTQKLNTMCPALQMCGLAPWINHVFPVVTTSETYTVSVVATDSIGATGSASVTVTVPAQMLTITPGAIPTSIVVGVPATFSWKISNSSQTPLPLSATIDWGAYVEQNVAVGQCTVAPCPVTQTLTRAHTFSYLGSPAGYATVMITVTDGHGVSRTLVTNDVRVANTGN